MREVLFNKPSGITIGGIHKYRALINGEWIYGTYAEVNKKYEDAKRDHLKKK